MFKDHFSKISSLYKDASEEQIKQAVSKCNIDYRVALAENSGLHDKTADLITVAQAFHWFCFEDFFKETKRVLKPDGFLAIWCYELLTTASPNLNQLEFWLKPRLLQHSSLDEKIKITIPIYLLVGGNSATLLITS